MRDGTIKWVLEVDSDGAIVNLSKFDKERKRVVNNTKKDSDTFRTRWKSAFKDFDARLDTSTDLIRDWGVAMRGFNTTAAVMGVTTLGGALAGLVVPAIQAANIIWTLPAAIAAALSIAAVLAVTFGGIGNAVKQMGKAAGGAAGGVKKLRNQLAGFDEMNVLTEVDVPDSAGAAGLADAMSHLSPAAQEVAKALYDIGVAFEKNVKFPAQEAALKGVAAALRETYAIIEGPLTTAFVTAGTALNGFLLEGLRVMRTPIFSAFIVQLGQLAADIITILTPSIGDVLTIIVNLVTLGTPYIKQFTQFIVDMAGEFAAFTSSVEGQTAIKTWVDNSIAAIKILGSIVGAVGGVIGAIFTASAGTGYLFENTLLDIINRFKEYLLTAEGQQFITDLIGTAAAVMEGFANAIGIVGGAVADVLKWFNALDEDTKGVITTFIGLVALATPVITYFSSLATSISSVGGILGVVTSALGGNDLKVALGLFADVKGPKDFAAAIDLVGGSFKTFGKALLGNPIFLIAGLLIAMYASSEQFRNAVNGLVTSLMGALMPIFQALGPLLETIFTAFGSIAGTLGDALAPVLTALTPILTIAGQILAALLVPAFQLLGWILTTIVVPILQFIITVLGVVIQVIAGVLIGTLQGLWTMAVDVFTNIKDTVIAAWNGIVAVWNVVATFFTDLFKAAWEGIKTAWSAVGTWFADLWNGIVAAVKWVYEMYISIWTTILNFLFNTIIKPIGTFFTNMWNGIVTTVTNVVNTIKNVWNGIMSWLNQYIITPIANFFSGLWDGITRGVQGLKDTITNIFNGIVSVIKQPINTIIDGFNTMIKGVNSLKIPDWVPGIGGKSLSLPLIPKLATGGITTGPTLAQIGEAGQEVVLPLENNTGWMDALASKIEGNGAEQNLHLTVKLGEDVIATKIIELINERTEMSGYNSILV